MDENITQLPTPAGPGANVNLTIETLEWLCQHGSPFVNDVAGMPHSTQPLHAIKVNRPIQSEIQFPNLSSLCEYLKYLIEEETMEIEEFSNKRLHVSAGPGEVRIFSEPLGPERERTLYGVAKFNAPRIQLDEWLNVEDMILMLTTKFEQNKDSEALVSLLSSLVATQEITKSDDGLSQQVSVREGITSDRVEVNPIRTLKPYRNFPEVGQVEERFLLRLRNYGNDFQATLICADSGMWAIDAISNIRDYMLNEYFDGSEAFTAKVQLNF